MVDSLLGPEGQAVLNTFGYGIAANKNRCGGVVDWSESFDPIAVTIGGIALGANASRLNTAKLLVNFATSRKGQVMIREMRRIPARSDVKPLAAKMDQSKLKAVPIEIYSGLDDHAREFRTIFSLEF